MKRILCFILIAALCIMPAAVNAEETDATIKAVCDSQAIEVGDQFMINFVMDKAQPYLTFQMDGEFNYETVQVVAPVYSNSDIGVIVNKFDNESGVFELVGYDTTISGIEDETICSILFKAVKTGEFSLSFNEKTRVGKAGEGGFYTLAYEGIKLNITDDTDGENVLIIEDTKPLTPYDDMSGFEWAEKAVSVLLKLEVLKDIADTSFFPGENVTRGDFLTMLMRVCKMNSDMEDSGFDDVLRDSYQFAPIKTAKVYKLALGDGEGNFYPDMPITREDACALVYRTMLRMDKVNPKINTEDYIGSFTDKSEIAPYAEESVAGLMRAKLLTGYEDGSFLPKNNMTRAEAAVLLNSLAEFNILISR